MNRTGWAGLGFGLDRQGGEVLVPDRRMWAESAPMLFQLFHTHRVPGALVLTAVLAIALPGCSKSHKKPAAQPKASATPTPSASPTPPPEPSANFVANGVAAADSQDRPAANAVANDVAGHVLATLNEFYNIGFLR